MGTATPTRPADTATITAHLSLQRLAKVYPGQTEPAVDAVSLTLREGKLLALLGPSGCGKTTTLRMIAGLVEPTAGAVEVGGDNLTDVPVHKRGMGMVFQSYALFPHLNVTRNVAFGLEMRKVDKREREQRVADALDMVQLQHLAKRRVKELSGGQQQRVALARALVVEPSVLLLDEPLSNLDAKLRESMRAEIRALVHRLGVTTVFVTHDQDEALSMADEIAVMNHGTIEQVGTPEQVYRRPASRFVADFIGRANLLTGTVADSDDSGATVEVPGVGRVQATHAGEPPAAGRTATVLLRPHHVIVRTGPTAPEDALHGRVVDRSYTGEMVSYTVEVGQQRLTAETLTGLAPAHDPGTEVALTWDVSDAMVLPPDDTT